MIITLQRQVLDIINKINTQEEKFEGDCPHYKLETHFTSHATIYKCIGSMKAVGWRKSVEDWKEIGTVWEDKISCSDKDLLETLEKYIASNDKVCPMCGDPINRVRFLLTL